MTKAATTNGYDPDKAKSYVERVENLKAEIRSIKARNAKECQDLQNDIADVLDEAKGDGFPKKELRKVLQTRELERKLEEVREDLEPDEQDRYDLLRFALGDIKDQPVGHQTDLVDALDRMKAAEQTDDGGAEPAAIGDQPATHH